MLNDDEHSSMGRGDASEQLPEVERQIADYWPVAAWCDAHVVLAVSGGADSVALLRAMVAIKQRVGGKGRLFVAHLNHGLRGAEADADAAWLVQLCERLQVPLEIGNADVAALAASNGDGWEAAAREARYDFLRQAAERLGARFVATGHTADDQAETILQRIVRGTGLAGLSGIAFARPLSESVSLVRPLLTVERRSIVDYLGTLGQDYRADASNDDSRHTRNRLRNELLPFLRDSFNADVAGALTRLGTQARESQQVIEALVADVAGRCIVIEGGVGPSQLGWRRLTIDCNELADEPAVIVREVCKGAWADANWPLQAMGYREWRLLAELASGRSEKNSLNLPGNIGARREGDRLILEPRGLS